jgi:hypothetical protein
MPVTFRPYWGLLALLALQLLYGAGVGQWGTWMQWAGTAVTLVALMEGAGLARQPHWLAQLDGCLSQLAKRRAALLSEIDRLQIAANRPDTHLERLAAKAKAVANIPLGLTVGVAAIGVKVAVGEVYNGGDWSTPSLALGAGKETIDLIRDTQAERIAKGVDTATSTYPVAIAAYRASAAGKE